jgi:hypothetical protein
MESMLDVLDKLVTKSGQHTTTLLHHSTCAAHSIGNSATTTLAKNAMAYTDPIHSGYSLSFFSWVALSLSLLQSLACSLARARSLSQRASERASESLLGTILHRCWRSGDNPVRMDRVCRQRVSPAGIGTLGGRVNGLCTTTSLEFFIECTFATEAPLL